MVMIYCVDTEKEVTPALVRDALIDCFVKAHSEVLDQFDEYSKLTETELEQMKKLDVKLLVQKAFRDTGGDFDNPTKQSLQKVIGELKKFATNFRQPGIVQKHADEIGILMEKLK